MYHLPPPLVYAPPPSPWSPLDLSRVPAQPAPAVPAWLPHAGPYAPPPPRKRSGTPVLVWLLLGLLGWSAQVVLVFALMAVSQGLAGVACGVLLALALCRPRGRFFARRRGIRR
jgi:hypothetical protein